MNKTEQTQETCPRCGAGAMTHNEAERLRFFDCHTFSDELDGKLTVSATCKDRQLAAEQQAHAATRRALEIMLEAYEVPDSLCDEHIGSSYCEEHCGNGMACLLHWAAAEIAAEQAVKPVPQPVERGAVEAEEGHDA